MYLLKLNALCFAGLLIPNVKKLQSIIYFANRQVWKQLRMLFLENWMSIFRKKDSDGKNVNEFPLIEQLQ